MRIEMLYFEGCPHHVPAVNRVREVLQQEGLSCEIHEIDVPDATAAQALGFAGSPTIRVNGVDIDPEFRGTLQPAPPAAMACRCYSDGVPSEDLIRAALREAINEERHARGN